MYILHLYYLLFLSYITKFKQNPKYTIFHYQIENINKNTILSLEFTYCFTYFLILISDFITHPMSSIFL